MKRKSNYILILVLSILFLIDSAGHAISEENQVTGEEKLMTKEDIEKDKSELKPPDPEQDAVIEEESDIMAEEGLTIEEEIANLQKKLIRIEENIANLNINLNAVKENLTIFLIKKDKDFEVTYIELMIHDKSWYKHQFTPEENNALENASLGNMLTKMFWGDIKKRRANIKIRCFYRFNGDSSKKEYNVLKDFYINPQEKISNFLAVTLQKDININSTNNINMSIAFW